jgi:hypothetical protein
VHSIIIALPFIDVRLVYAIVTFVDILNNKMDSAFVTKNLYKYIFSVAPELAAVTTYCWAGINTRHIKIDSKAARYTQVDTARLGDPPVDQVPLSDVLQQQNGAYEPYR